jgi:hypothetical protein
MPMQGRATPRFGAPPRPACCALPHAGTGPREKFWDALRVLAAVVSLGLLAAAAGIFLVAGWFAEMTPGGMDSTTRPAPSSRRAHPTDVPAADE